MDTFYLEVGGVKFPFPHQYLDENDIVKHLNHPQVFIDSWKKFFRPGDVVLDIGGYIGIVSVHLALMGGIVHTFEGSPRNIERLKGICSPLRQITVHGVALHSVGKKCRTRFNDCISREHPEQEIKYVVFDEYAKDIPDPAFVKMDIEGMESMALLGMRKLLDARPIWQIECHRGIPWNYSDYPGFVEKEDGGFDFNTFYDFDYKIFSTSWELVTPEDMKCFENYFFVPNEKKINPRILL
jgi:FkbM family methyltransferase